MTPTTLYRFWDAAGVLLYVGMTGVGTVRWFTHAREKAWWNQVATITVEHFADRATASVAERKAILTEQPKYNIAGLLPPVQPARSGSSREYGTGSVFWHGRSKRWVASLPNGLGRGCRYFRTKAEAEQYLDWVLADPRRAA